MKLTIKGSVGTTPVDLEVELDKADFAQAISLLNSANVDIRDQLNKNQSKDQVDDSPLVKSRPEAKTSELSLSLEYIKAKHEVTQYQLIDHLADEGHRDANIKRAIMWLKHHADIKVDTVSKGEHSQYFVFRWIGEA